MKRLLLVTAFILVLALALGSCDQKTEETGGTHTDGTLVIPTAPTERDETPDATETDNVGETDNTGETADPDEPDNAGEADEDDVDSFVDEHFGIYGDDGEYNYKQEVGGAPVIEYGVYDENGQGETYTPGDPDAPAVHIPVKDPDTAGGTENTESYASGSDDEPEPDPTPSESEPSDPQTSQSTEEGTSESEPEPDPITPPAAPKDAYAIAISAIDDYTADVKYVCEVELSDGSVSRYVYKYRVNKTGDDYTADYTEQGTQKTATFSAADGIMNINGAGKSATLTDFYRFCSMIEPLPLSLYYYEHSAAGTDFSARLSAEDYRSLLLNTSPLFTGFDTMDGIGMRNLYVNGHVDADGVYTGGEMAFDMSLDDKILGEMLFRVSVEVDYVY